jgi:hypothetical protein
MQTKADRTKVPKFATEAEEAKWWDDHKEMVEENLIQAIRDGTARRGTAQRLVREARASRNVTIRIADADLDLSAGSPRPTSLPTSALPWA